MQDKHSLPISEKTSPDWRRLFSAFCLLAIIAVPSLQAENAFAQSAGKAAQKTPKKSAAGTAAQPSMPSAEAVLILIRSTLVSLNDALRTGNFTVLRDLAAPSFAQANSAGRLYRVFSNLSRQGIDLSAVTILAPQLPQTPQIDKDGFLNIQGFFPGQPIQINFAMAFQLVGKRWRLMTLSVNPVKSTATASNKSKGKAEEKPKKK